MRQRTVIALIAALAIGGLAAYLFIGTEPTEKALLENFRTHRVAFERLRDLVREDDQLRRLADWGIQTNSSPLAVVPPDGNFSVDRFGEYLALLKEAGAIAISQSRDDGLEIYIDVWGSGWASDTRHLAVCWLEKQPENLLAHLPSKDRNEQSRHGKQRDAIIHVDTNWYIQKDW